MRVASGSGSGRETNSNKVVVAEDLIEQWLKAGDAAMGPQKSRFGLAARLIARRRSNHPLLRIADARYVQRLHATMMPGRSDTYSGAPASGAQGRRRDGAA